MIKIRVYVGSQRGISLTACLELNDKPMMAPRIAPPNRYMFIALFNCIATNSPADPRPIANS